VKAAPHGTRRVSRWCGREAEWPWDARRQNQPQEKKTVACGEGEEERAGENEISTDVREWPETNLCHPMQKAPTTAPCSTPLLPRDPLFLSPQLRHELATVERHCITEYDSQSGDSITEAHAAMAITHTKRERLAESSFRNGNTHSGPLGAEAWITFLCMFHGKQSTRIRTQRTSRGSPCVSDNKSLAHLTGDSVFLIILFSSLVTPWLTKIRAERGTTTQRGKKTGHTQR
jgi:hypothetical protein